MRIQRIGPFTLEAIRRGGRSWVELRFSDVLLTDWGSFDTEDEAILRGVSNLKMMCQEVLKDG